MEPLETGRESDESVRKRAIRAGGVFILVHGARGGSRASRMMWLVVLISGVAGHSLIAPNASAVTYFLKHDESRSGNAWYAVKFHAEVNDEVVTILSLAGPQPLASTLWLTRGCCTPVLAIASLAEEDDWQGTVLTSNVAPFPVEISETSGGSAGDAPIFSVRITFLSRGDYTLVQLAAGDPLTSSRFRYYATNGLNPLGTSSGANATAYTELDFAGLLNVRTTETGSYLAYARDVSRREDATVGGLFAAFVGIGTSTHSLRVESPTASMPTQTSYAMHNSPHAWRFWIREYFESAASNEEAGHILLTVADVTMPG